MGISLKGILSAVAPILAGALPGPLGGMARRVVADALGTDDSDAAIEKALANTNPEMLLKLKDAEQKFRLDMEQAGIDLEKISAADRADARSMQVQTKAWIPPVLAMVVTVGFFAVAGFLIFRTFPQANTEVLMMLLGQLAAGWTMILSFYFGSSSSSHAKDDVIAKLKA